MADTHALATLVQALKGLPGVGIKSAQRMAFQLLQNDRATARQLSAALDNAVQKIRHCACCHTFTEAELCDTCLDSTRDRTVLCVIETPADQSAIERTGTYRGLYFVLMGKLSPLDGIGPHDIGLAKLKRWGPDGSHFGDEFHCRGRSHCACDLRDDPAAGFARDAPGAGRAGWQ